MGTRALVDIFDKDNNVICTIYRQFDGYPDGLGAELEKICNKRTMVNGFSDPATQANGMGCLAALIVSELKGDQCGNVYLYPPNESERDYWQEYEYQVKPGDPHAVVTHKAV